jgi:hypothetical protein
MAQCTRSASLSEFSDTGARDPDPAIDVDIKRQGSPALRHISQLAQRGGVGWGGNAQAVDSTVRWISCSQRKFPAAPRGSLTFHFHWIRNPAQCCEHFDHI